MNSKLTMKPDKLVTIGQFSQGVEAHLCKTKLESEGIQCFIQDENVISANWLYSNAIGGVKLQAKESDVERVRKIFTGLEEVSLQNNSESEILQQSCPYCNSTDISYEKIERKPTFWSWLFIGLLWSWVVMGILLPFIKRKRICNKCGYSWKIS